MVIAIGVAMKDQELRGFRFRGPFTNQIATYVAKSTDAQATPAIRGYGGKGAGQQNWNRPAPYKVGRKGGVNNFNGGKGKKGGKGGLHSKATGGNTICFGYNNNECSDNSICGMMHVCQRCGKGHRKGDSSCSKCAGKHKGKGPK
jgi:hypothetical protein